MSNVVPSIKQRAVSVRRLAALAVVGAFVFGLAGYVLAAEACSQRFGQPDVCHVSLLAVLGSPHQYSSRTIQVVGYLALDSRVLTVYPNREAYLMGDKLSSLELIADYESLRTASNRWSYSYVLVRGMFRAGDATGTQGARLGVLENARVVAPMTPRSEDQTNLDPVMRIEQESDD